MGREYFIWNMKGVLLCEDLSLVDFEIKERQLIYARDLSNGERYPWALFRYGLTYQGFNTFFNMRVVRDYAQDLRDYLECMGLKAYDFEALVKKMNGWNALDMYWVRFDDLGARCWADICSQKYPIF